MTASSSTAERMSGIFREVFDDDGINVRDDMTARDVEEWDSLRHIDLIYALEEEFKIVFTAGEAGKALKNVGELRALIEKKLAGRSG